MGTRVGYDELRNYIENNKNPSMIGFVTKNADQLAYLSTSTSNTTPQGYFNHWKNQFVMAVCEFRPDLNIRCLSLDIGRYIFFKS
ncbi:hypothetical protein BDB00DRAFT_834228 [Zychaea mexicana]|uniref:uncharacterized protein n=1 Tax=Zychaea mexicana TaxID=64656 RepID=UPI0022FDD38D|nr:uncharacterized protein BDB00DRAFT_834228 [Zychaea mexicana]KAI9491202.1 hypothetical protein BDB00DRAFT_834228 [Zychaea mexicana]